MKKVLFMGALALSVCSFAKTNETSNVDKHGNKETSAFLLKAGVYTVTFTLPCGGETTAYYYTNQSEGTSGFNRDLALAVNMTVEEQCGSGSSQSGIGF